MKIITLTDNKELQALLKNKRLRFVNTFTELGYDQDNRTKLYPFNYYEDDNGQIYRYKLVPKNLRLDHSNRQLIENIIKSYQINLEILFKSIRDNAEFKIVNNNVTKTIHPRIRMRLILSRKIKDEVELENMLNNIIIEETGKLIDEFAEQNNISTSFLIESILDIPQMHDKPENKILTTAFINKLNSIQNDQKELS